MRDLNVCEAVLLVLLLVVLTSRRRGRGACEPFTNEKPYDKHSLVLSDDKGNISTLKVSDLKAEIQTVIDAQTKAALAKVNKYADDRAKAAEDKCKKAYTKDEMDAAFVRIDEPVYIGPQPTTATTAAQRMTGTALETLTVSNATAPVGGLGHKRVLYMQSGNTTKWYLTRA